MNSNHPQIACVIVTYNRKTLLRDCLDAVASQTYKPHTVYITDNASTDGTMESVKEWGYYECERDGIRFKYILNSKNEGGAGGFYLGMKTAHETGLFDAIWVMDDDGVPDKECLEKLSSHIPLYDYLSPLVISSVNDNVLAFSYNGLNDVNSVISKYSCEGKIMGYACPFNGILYSDRLVSTIGYPRRDMFIWGDENNYDMRCRDNGFERTTIIDAIHRHPKNRQVLVEFMGREMVEINQHWKAYCYYRNFTYNYWCGRHVKGILLFFIHHFLFAVFHTRSLYRVKCLFSGVYDGLMSDFTNLEKYMKNGKK